VVSRPEHVSCTSVSNDILTRDVIRSAPIQLPIVENLIMLKGFAIAAICIGTLATVDYEFYGGIYTDRVFQMLRQIGYSFGY
jgi:hypothetical protein